MSETKNLDGKLQGILIKGYTTLLADLGMPYGEATPKIVSRRVKETEAQIKELGGEEHGQAAGRGEEGGPVEHPAPGLVGHE